MTLEARITVHQRGPLKPNYNDIHQRMANAGYVRTRMVGGHSLSELHGMYRKIAFAGTIDAEEKAIENALRSNGFAFSIELFQVGASKTFNLEPAPNYGALLGLYASGR